MSESIILSDCVMEIGENGILYVHYQDDITIDEASAAAIIQVVEAICPHGDLKLLIIHGSDNALTFAAQKKLATVPRAGRVALLVNGRFTQDVFNVLSQVAKVFRMRAEFRAFEATESAEHWLLS